MVIRGFLGISLISGLKSWYETDFGLVIIKVDLEVLEWLMMMVNLEVSKNRLETFA